MPSPAAVRAAPTVPECRIRCPVFAPGLMPGGDDVGPVAERAEAREVHRRRRWPFDREHRHVRDLGPVPRRDRDRLGPVQRTDGRAPAPLRSDAGATTKTS